MSPKAWVVCEALLQLKPGVGKPASREAGGGGRPSAGRGENVYTEQVKRWTTEKPWCGGHSEDEFGRYLQGSQEKEGDATQPGALQPKSTFPTGG